MSSTTTIFLLLFVIFAFCLSENGVYAFGAGNIPSFAYMEGRAFRHGDIEDILAELVKRSGGFALTAMLSKGHKFNGLDIKRVYFGNWLRDYSQAVDIASLKKVPLQTIINLCMVLGFLAHGYATNEFEVTPERLGCYLPTEHIDNPKGYGEGEDARKYHPGLRGPVDPRELEIDYRTGMKNYIANEDGTWDTSKGLVRRTLEKCIHLGRLHRSQGRKQDEYEAYRLLGQAMHTLEDFPAHSNFCELALVSMGNQQVFVHVGDQIRIQAPSGKWVAPIVTGSFGSSDFIHSLLGEATDHLSEASVTDLNRELDRARSKSIEQSTRSGPGGSSSDSSTILRQLFTSIPGSEGGEMSRDMDAVERIRAGPAGGGKRPEDMSPQELHAVLWQVLTFRDSVVKKISKTIEKIPGLGPLIEKIMDGISVFVFTTLEPFLKPLLKSATSSLSTVSGEVIDTHDQYEVFNDPRASDPTHSFLSKDHFNLILNEPAGRLGQVIVKNTVTLVVKAWDNAGENVQAVTEEILQCMFHPDFHNPNSRIQREMLQNVNDWYQGLGKRQKSILSRLEKNPVRNHENVRAAGEGGKPAATGSFAATQGMQFQQDIVGYAQNVPGAQAIFSATGFGKPGKADKPSKPGKHDKPPKPGKHDKPGKGKKRSGGDDEEGGGVGASSYPYSGGYAPPPGPPPPATSSYPGMGAPPSFPGMNAPSGGGDYQPQQRSGYSPAYISPSISATSSTSSYHNPGGGGVAPSFPGFPGSGSNTAPSGFSSYAPPPGPPPGFPGAAAAAALAAHASYAPPAGPPPGFPGAASSREAPHPPSGGFGFPDVLDEDAPFGSGPPGFPSSSQPPTFPSFGGGAQGQGHHGYGGQQQQQQQQQQQHPPSGW